MAFLRKENGEFHPLKGEKQAIWLEKGQDHANPGSCG